MAPTSRNRTLRAVSTMRRREGCWSERPDSILSVTLQFLPNSFAGCPRDRRMRVCMIADLRTPWQFEKRSNSCRYPDSGTRPSATVSVALLSRNSLPIRLDAAPRRFGKGWL